MKILLVGQFFFPDTFGGAGRYLHDLAVGLRIRGHRVIVLTQQFTNTPSEEIVGGIRVVRYGPLQHWWQLPMALRNIRYLFRRLHDQEPFKLIAICQPLPALPLLLERRARTLTWVYHFLSPWSEESRIERAPRHYDLAKPLVLWTRWTIEHLVLRQTRRQITLSESMKAILVAVHRASADRVDVVPGCVDLQHFQPLADRTGIRRQLGLSNDRRLILTVRGLVERQNLDNLIKAMPMVVDKRPATLLLIVGSGPLWRNLQALIHSLKLEAHVRLLGAIRDADLPRWYQATDLFVMPSKALEAFGLVTLEALACGIPVVGTPVGGTRELLNQLDGSLLCGGIEPEAIASAMLRALKRLSDPRTSQELSTRCRVFAEQFSPEIMAEHVERVYQHALRIRVLHVHTLPVISGSGLNTFLTMRGLPEERYTAELSCAPGGPLLELVQQAGMVVRPLPHMVQPIHPLHDLLAVLEVWRLMRRHRYTIVHTHNSKAGFVGRLAATLARVPVILHTVHGFAFHTHERWWRRWLFRVLERLAARWCDHLIMISEPLIDWALRERIAPREQMTKIYSGIDLSAFRQPGNVTALRAELGFRNHEFVVGEVAKLWPGKGHEVLFRAAATLKARIPQLRLMVVGEGELRQTLQELAKRLGIHDRVVFTGFRQDVPTLTHLFDVAVLPSFFEGMGRAIIEAQAAGKPVIASCVGGIPDLIVEGQTGLLVEPGNVEQLAEAIWRLYTQPELRRQLGQAAQRAVDGRFEANAMVQQIVNLYDKLLQQQFGTQDRKP